jgi:hypothetical protein
MLTMAKHAQNPRLRPSMSEAQKEKLRQAQLRYIAQDPRWPAHRAKLSKSMSDYTSNDPRFPEHCRTASERQRWKLFEEEKAAAQELLQRGRNFEYVSETLCVSTEVLRRELKANGIDTRPAPPEKRAKRGKGFWRCMDAAHA